MMPIWYLISDEARERIKSVMPKTWRPPRQKTLEVILDPKVETDAKVEKLYRNNPYIEI